MAAFEKKLAIYKSHFPNDWLIPLWRVFKVKPLRYWHPSLQLLFSLSMFQLYMAVFFTIAGLMLGTKRAISALIIDFLLMPELIIVTLPMSIFCVAWLYKNRRHHKTLLWEDFT